MDLEPQQQSQDQPPQIPQIQPQVQPQIPARKKPYKKRYPTHLPRIEMSFSRAEFNLIKRSCIHLHGKLADGLWLHLMDAQKIYMEKKTAHERAQAIKREAGHVERPKDANV